MNDSNPYETNTNESEKVEHAATAVVGYDRWIKTSIENLIEPDDFEPEGIHVEFRFVGHDSIERTYKENGDFDPEDIDNSWQQNGVVVHETEVLHGTGKQAVTLESETDVYAEYKTFPSGNKRTYWLIITPIP